MSLETPGPENVPPTGVAVSTNGFAPRQKLFPFKEIVAFAGGFVVTTISSCALQPFGEVTTTLYVVYPAGLTVVVLLAPV